MEKSKRCVPTHIRTIFFFFSNSKSVATFLFVNVCARKPFDRKWIFATWKCNKIKYEPKRKKKKDHLNEMSNKCTRIQAIRSVDLVGCMLIACAATAVSHSHYVYNYNQDTEWFLLPRWYSIDCIENAEMAVKLVEHKFFIHICTRRMYVVHTTFCFC